jgi:hypothetical protein
MITIIISISIWIVSAIGYIIWNLFQKNKKLESLVIGQQTFINGIKESMRDINKAAEQIDSKLWVQSDPEFLSLMENVKTMQNSINQFIEQ